MKLLGSILIVLPFVSMLALRAQDHPQSNQPDEDAQRNIEYQKAGELSLKVDIFRPKDHSKDPLPAIVWFHGGGWNHGAKEGNPWRETMFVQHGYCFISVDYRLSTVAPFPAQIEDCKCAVRWVRKNAQQYGVDPNHIGAFGYSAGGHLALMTGCADEKAGLEGSGGNAEVSSRVQAVCSWAGPTDLADTPNGPLEDAGAKQIWDTATRQLCGGTPAEKPDIYRRASPITYADKSNPPILMLHGESDELVPIKQAETMAQKLESTGAKVKLIRVKDLKHGMKISPPGNYTPSVDELRQMVLDFFDSELKPAVQK